MSARWVIRRDGPFGVSYFGKDGTPQDQRRSLSSTVKEVVGGVVGSMLAPFTAGIGAVVASKVESILKPNRFGNFYTVESPAEANWYESKDEAESDALILASKAPRLIGELSVREWNGRERYP